ncbi:MAG: efflux transporter periplasmic adaptor subunit [Cyanobacteria bacterium QH_9_48_43]|jgi:HlyD family secretion protein|nr:MAG: efflux transporter periplasmic adaptor subunit [Cyanobacteria bacterium QH_10_48_56]PSO86950.1 MAG: efflux transporter periplasmic adaptor subunit [Cyanobacteria bacterium QH_9_48_43]PSP09045.1 MAG: efflux transporter periplasmic adaptor subunit [Cyanobacteria bacterium SW_10_48_33]PSP19480.1 MAG: efflux transporter periplasmic adaptor subunit [Cyanobacteria bacterium SW_5_48_44]
MEFPLLGKVKRPLRWFLGLVATGTLVVGTTTYVVSDRNPQYDLEELTVPVKEQDLRVSIEASGTVVPVKSVNISPKNSGRIAELFVEQGDRVQQGEKLARMENEDYEAQLSQARANLNEAQARLEEAQAGTPQEVEQAQAQVASAQSRFELAQQRRERYQSLLEKGAISQDRFDEVLSEYLSAQANLEQARRSLEQTRNTNRPEINRLQAAVESAQAQYQEAQVQFQDTIIKAPFAGIITQKYATEGAFVTPTTSASSTASATSTSILAIAEGLEVLAKVPEVDVGRIEVGQPAKIVADAYQGEVFRGEVKRVAPEAVVEQNVTSFEVLVTLFTGQSKLRSGMNVDATFLGKQLQDALTVPTVAVVTQEGKTGVMVPGEDNQPQFQPVTLGLTISERTQILQGLESGERVFIDLPEGSRPKNENS